MNENSINVTNEIFIIISKLLMFMIKCRFTVLIKGKHMFSSKFNKSVCVILKYVKVQLGILIK